MRRRRGDAHPRRASVGPMGRVHILAAALLAFSCGLARAQAPVSEAAKEIVGAWEISNADRDRRCAVTFSVDPAPGGFKLDLEADCGLAFPPLKDVVAWT